MTKWKISAKWANRVIDCTVAGIVGRCGGKCCYDQFWPGSAQPQPNGGCFYLGPKGCTLDVEDRPVTCHLFPFKLNQNNTLTQWHRATMKNQCCAPNFNEGQQTIIETMEQSLRLLFGDAQADAILAGVRGGKDVEVNVPEHVERAYLQEHHLRPLYH